ncbi:amidohydrolase family protein [bacterium]|nr:amidohydrolase family protein [bacterium]
MEIFDVLIHGGTVIDGSGNPGVKADVLIRGASIVRIGAVNISNISAKEIIDATGKVVTPGFIDSHAHGSPAQTPEFKNYSGMGVTTIVLGQDGSSATDISAWMKQVEATHPAINIASLVGHGSIRDLAGVKLNPDPSPEDLQQMADLVDDALEAGCFGLSTGLEYQPGSFSKLDELIAIAAPVGKRGGLVHSHTRNEDNDAIENSIAELVAQGAGGGCAVNISHLKVVYGQGKQRAQEILAQMAIARNEGVFLTADIYPYLASYTGIGIVFPDWAKPPYQYEEVVKTRRAELSAYLKQRVILRNGPEATLFGTAPWAGKTLGQLASELNKPFEDVLIDDIGPDGASAAYFVMDQELQDQLFIDPYVMVCSDGSPSMRHPRAYGSFAKVLRYYVRETKMLDLEQAVHKMTGLPAATLGLVDQKRGLLKVGFAADILVFDPNTVTDKATFENPHLLAEGFDRVIVNGVSIRAAGDFTGDRGGKMLRKISKPGNNN